MKLSEFYLLEAEMEEDEEFIPWDLVFEMNEFFWSNVYIITQGEKTAYGVERNNDMILDKNHRIMALLLLSCLAEDQGL